MQNTLKIALLLVGLGLIGYGVYTFFFPHISLETGAEKVNPQADSTQALAMIGLGALSLLSGIAFRKR